MGNSFCFDIGRWHSFSFNISWFSTFCCKCLILLVQVDRQIYVFEIFLYLPNTCHDRYTFNTADIYIVEVKVISGVKRKDVGLRKTKAKSRNWKQFCKIFSQIKVPFTTCQINYGQGHLRTIHIISSIVKRDHYGFYLAFKVKNFKYSRDKVLRIVLNGSYY